MYRIVLIWKRFLSSSHSPKNVATTLKMIPLISLFDPRRSFQFQAASKVRYIGVTWDTLQGVFPSLTAVLMCFGDGFLAWIGSQHERLREHGSVIDSEYRASLLRGLDRLTRDLRFPRVSDEKVPELDWTRFPLAYFKCPVDLLCSVHE